MLDTLRPPPAPTPAVSAAPAPARAATATPSVHFELVVTANPDALHRIVRVASAAPYVLLTLRLGAPTAGRRRLRLSVAGDESGFETLRKRLGRVIDTVTVKVVP